MLGSFALARAYGEAGEYTAPAETCEHGRERTLTLTGPLATGRSRSRTEIVAERSGADHPKAIAKLREEEWRWNARI